MKIKFLIIIFLSIFTIACNAENKGSKINSKNILVTAGGFEVEKDNDNYTFNNPENTNWDKTVSITEVLDKYSKNVNSYSIWITRDWQSDWYPIDKINENTKKGYIPVFIYYTIGDQSSIDYIKNNEKDYFERLNRFKDFLSKIKGDKYVIFEPEYNQNGTESWTGMNNLFNKSFEILHSINNVKVGPCIGDFGNYNLINDLSAWNLFDNSIKDSIKNADFISFQEMRALSRNTKIEIFNTPERAKNFSIYLTKKYNKPTMLAYISISDYEFGEDNQAKVFKDFVKELPEMKSKGNLKMIGLMHYFDYPNHEGYFYPAYEERFGVITSNGRKKESFKYFNEFK